MMKRRLILHAVVLIWLLASVAIVRGAEPERGLASWYGPGDGVATQWCTWTLRHTRGCGRVAIQSDETGIRVVVPVVDWCQCYRGTTDERIVDLQLNVLYALGLTTDAGLYPVTVERLDDDAIPDTAMRP